MQKLLVTAAMFALAGCSGEGGSGPASGTLGTASTAAPGGTTPERVTPTFRLAIPARKTKTGAKKPGFVSSATLSISIDLTLVNGVSPSTVPGNPALRLDGCYLQFYAVCV